MAKDTNGFLETGLYCLLPETYISTLQLICVYLDIKEAERQPYSLLEDGLATLQGLARKHLHDGISHVAEIVALYEHGERYADQNASSRSSIASTFLVPTQRLQTFRDVTNDNILKLLSRSTPKLDRLQVFYNVYLTWLQSLSPPAMEWHFHSHNDHLVRFCATLENFSIIDCTAAIAIITYLLRTLSILLGYGDVKDDEKEESCMKRVNGEVKHYDGSIAKFVEALLKFSYVNFSRPHVGWEFKNRVCKHGSPVFPSLELYRKVDVSYHDAFFGLLSGPSGHMAALVCQACELIHLDGYPLRGDLLNVIVLSFALANSSGNEMAAKITTRMLLKCIKESPADIRLHSHVLEPVFAAQNAFLNDKCSDPSLSVELYVKLMVTLMDDTNDKTYVVLERLVDRLIFLKCQDATVSFLKCYSILLDSVPLACSVTLIQLFELLIITVDARRFDSVTVALECLEAVSLSLPDDANIFWLEVCHWFLVPYMLHLCDAETGLLNTVLGVIETNSLLTKLKFRPPALEGHICFDKFSSEQRHYMKKRYNVVWKLLCENKPVDYMHNRLKELRGSLEDQMRANGVVMTEGVQATLDYYSWLITLTLGVNTDDSFMLFRASQRARSPPRKQRIKQAIKQQYYEDVRKLLTIAPVDEHATVCAKCQGPLPMVLTWPIGMTKFACQLCTDTCCRRCKCTVLLTQEDSVNSQVGAVLCKECSDYVKKLRSCVLTEPASDTFTRLTGDFNQILELYQDLNSTLFQLQGYVKLCSIHRQLEEPLPHGTKEKMHKLLADVISQRKHVSDIKKGIANCRMENECSANLLTAVRRSVLVLSTGILYKTIPKINEVVHNFTKLGQIDPV